MPSAEPFWSAAARRRFATRVNDSQTLPRTSLFPVSRFAFSECGGSTPLCHSRKTIRRRRLALLNILPTHREVVLNLHAFRSHSPDRFVKWPFRFSLKPSRRTPLVFLCPAHQSVSDCVRVHVVQSRQIRPLVRDARIPVLKPDFASRSFIITIDFFRSDAVQMADESRQSRRLLRRYRNEVIVVWKHRPCFEPPFVTRGKMQKGIAQVREPLGGAEEWPLLIRPRCHHIRARCVQTMHRAMRPLRHGREFTFAPLQKQSGVEPPHSKKNSHVGIYFFVCSHRLRPSLRFPQPPPLAFSPTTAHHFSIGQQGSRVAGLTFQAP